MSWIVAAPEIYYMAAGLLFLLLSIAAEPSEKRDHVTALVLAGVGVAVTLASVGVEGPLFIRAYRVDLFTQIFKAMLSIGLFLVVCVSGNITDIEDSRRSDFYVLLFVCTLAMMLLVSADHIISLYVSLELSSYSLYVLVALRRDKSLGLEAGLKYFLVGTFSSAILLFGLALLYGTAHIAYIGEAARMAPEILSRPAVLLGILLVLGGLFFKLAVFPFHVWAPDVYQGAVNQVTTYIATASKVAAIAVILRIVSALGQGSIHLAQVLVIISVLSMTVGNLAAIVQTDVKRILAYSTVAHAGYVLIGVLAMNAEGYAGAIFYALSLLVMKFTVFMVVIQVAYDGRNVQIAELAGLHRQSPILALALLVALFSLAGIPPTIGFTGKFLVFIAAMERGYFLLVLIAMINVVISLYYYLLIIKAAYLREPEEEPLPLAISLPIRVLALGLVAVILVAGFFPKPILDIADAAARVLMGV